MMDKKAGPNLIDTARLMFAVRACANSGFEVVGFPDSLPVFWSQLSPSAGPSVLREPSFPWASRETARGCPRVEVKAAPSSPRRHQGSPACDLQRALGAVPGAGPRLPAAGFSKAFLWRGVGSGVRGLYLGHRGGVRCPGQLAGGWGLGEGGEGSACLPCSSPPGMTWDGFALAPGAPLPGDELGGPWCVLGGGRIAPTDLLGNIWVH